MRRLSTGSNSFDDLLGGGIECGSVTLLYGEAGTGKTNICLQAAFNLIQSEGKKVAYVDTEGLSSDRIEQISSGEEARKNLLVFQVRSFEEQIDRIAKVVRLAEANDKIGLIIVDSMTMYYRLKSDDTSVRNEFVKQTEMLLNAARKSEVAVLLTSQVYTNIGAGTIEFLGGHAMHHNAKTIIRLEKKGNGRRVAVMVKHRSIPEGRKALYSITEKGISD
ncbi:MAG: DNA repair and recombination protein RadB [Candidatus Methanomethylophilaceae archaeon]|nr:DNA repair and recombination protein RadB [Candidatus Methanomethylophilaceae archaeon]